MNIIMYTGVSTSVSLEAVRSCPTVQETLDQVTRGARFDHAILSISANSTAELPYVWCTLSGAWLSYYIRRSYYRCDAVAQAGYTRSKPFFWSDLKLEGHAREFMEESARHGIGPCGYSIPIKGVNGRRTLLSVSSRTMIEADWRYYISATKHDLRKFAELLQLRALKEINLKPDELYGMTTAQPN